MMRFIAALTLLAVVTLMSIGGLWLQNDVTDRLLSQCDKLIALCEQGQTDQCRQAAESLSDSLKERMRLFPFFLRHERMETVFQSAQSLPLLVEDKADFLTAVSTMRTQLQILMNNEWPTPENIL